MTRWFVSDHHFAHWNIIRYCHRPFKDTREMDDAMMTYHNELVKPEDHVSFLGDVTIVRGGRVQKEWFCRLIRAMHGHKRLYLGNHDHFPIQTYIDAGFEKVYATWRDEKGIIFSHIPIHPKSMGSAIANVHGHTHNNTTQDGKVVEFEPVMSIDKKTQRVVYRPYVNVSVEVIDYRPVNYDTLLQMVVKLKGEWEGVKT